MFVAEGIFGEPVPASGGAKDGGTSKPLRPKSVHDKLLNHQIDQVSIEKLFFFQEIAKYTCSLKHIGFPLTANAMRPVAQDFLALPSFH